MFLQKPADLQRTTRSYISEGRSLHNSGCSIQFCNPYQFENFGPVALCSESKFLAIFLSRSRRILEQYNDTGYGS
jgi:hypothetical protein